MNKFVFVVCGAREHISELNISLKFLRHFTKNEIIVISDLKRNEIFIEHDNILDVHTPSELNNHEASIYIKTGLYKYLKDDNLYCYLDGDVIAMSDKVDEIFSCFQEPIIFGKDHCLMNEFSPHALNCGCIKVDFSDELIRKQFLDLEALFVKYRKYPFRYFFQNARYLLLRYVFPVKELNFSKYRFKKADMCWYNGENRIILEDYNHNSKKVYGKPVVEYSNKEEKWINKKGINDPFLTKCNHLAEYISNKHGLNIPYQWQHWNGGVFLFNKSSSAFLNKWHSLCVEEFKNNLTKTRDQLSLIVTVWDFKLENNSTLPSKYNWLAGYKNNRVAFDRNKGYTRDSFATIENPVFLHVYDGWSKTGWSVWDAIIETAKENGIAL